MKKIIIGAIVGGIILFLWQFLSWTILNLHYNAYQYTEKQDSVLQYLETQFHEDGQYMMPSLKPGATMDEHEAAMKAAAGKPWAVIAYHTSMDTAMVPNMIRGFVSNIILMALFCWIISGLKNRSFGTIFLASLFTGVIIFLNAPYTLHIWFHTAGITADFRDALISWGLVGIWLGWYMREKTS